MTTIDDIAKTISKQLNEDYDVVYKICNTPFIFTAIVMKDKEDKHSILFNKLFKFSLKNKFL